VLRPGGQGIWGLWGRMSFESAYVVADAEGISVREELSPRGIHKGRCPSEKEMFGCFELNIEQCRPSSRRAS